MSKRINIMLPEKTLAVLDKVASVVRLTLLYIWQSCS